MEELDICIFNRVGIPPLEPGFEFKLLVGLYDDR